SLRLSRSLGPRSLVCSTMPPQCSPLNCVWDHEGGSDHQRESGKMRKPANRACSRDRGAAAVEFAIILPLLFLVIAGIIDMGRLFYGQIVAANLAREVARMSAIGYEDDEVDLTIQNWNLGGGLISGDPPAVSVTPLCADDP